MTTANNRVFPFQTVYINGTDVSTVNDTTPTYPGGVGMCFSKQGNDYQYVQFLSTTTTIAAGTPVMWNDYNDYIVSAKVADAKRNFPAGFALGAVTAGNYGWIQVGGPYATAVTTGGTFAAGDVAIMSATDGQLVAVTAGTAPTYIPMGIATAANVSSAVAIQITVPRNF